MFRAADVVDGSYRFAVFGLGVVTLSPQVVDTHDRSGAHDPDHGTTTGTTTSPTAPRG